jgi:hypothetical protein
MRKALIEVAPSAALCLAINAILAFAPRWLVLTISAAISVFILAWIFLSTLKQPAE